MKFHLMLSVALCLAFSSVVAQNNKTGATKKTLTYDTLQRQTFPPFTYQPATAPALVAIRDMYQLDTIAGNGSETDRAIRLLDWFHKQVPHEDAMNIPVLNAQSIIDYHKESGKGQGCYPLAIAMNEIFLAAGFKSRTVICFSLLPDPDGGHVINAVYINALNKWIYMDPQDNAWIKDEKGNFLSIEEVSDRLRDGRPMALNATANYHGIPTKKDEYLYEFMAEHLYRVICPVNSEYNSQTRSGGKLLEYVELLPVGSLDPRVDIFETSVRGNHRVVNYHTNNNRAFWQKP